MEPVFYNGSVPVITAARLHPHQARFVPLAALRPAESISVSRVPVYCIPATQPAPLHTDAQSGTPTETVDTVIAAVTPELWSYLPYRRPAGRPLPVSGQTQLPVNVCSGNIPAGPAPQRRTGKPGSPPGQSDIRL